MSNLHKARYGVKNDEFYTQLVDIENELKYYEYLFKDKTILCNCDDHDSNFFKYFSTNAVRLEVKKVIVSINDFKSSKSIEQLKEADIVITNPPFSLFGEYLQLLMKYDKKFLIIGDINKITNRKIFPLIQKNKIWCGMYSGIMKFVLPNKKIKKFGNICWFTNMRNCTEKIELKLTKRYTLDKYPKYNNYDVINIDKVKDIPIDYEGVMGVPLSFITKHNTSQFEILGLANDEGWINYKCITKIGKRNVYNRILIRKIVRDENE